MSSSELVGAFGCVCELSCCYNIPQESSNKLFIRTFSFACVGAAKLMWRTAARSLKRNVEVEVCPGPDVQTGNILPIVLPFHTPRQVTGAAKKAQEGRGTIPTAGYADMY